MVTHNGGELVQRQLDSIEAQTQKVDHLVVLDDASSDGTAERIQQYVAHSATPVTFLTSRDPQAGGSPHTRIATNFQRALRQAQSHDYVLLADQDDEWLPTRVATQVEVMNRNPEIWMTAGDGQIVDSNGVLSGTSLRDAFPVPPNWESLTAREQFRAILRRPLVTGACACLRPALLDAAFPIPAGWLHDRWLSIVAGAAGRLSIANAPVIRYRVHEAQVVGTSGERSVGHRVASVWATRPIDASRRLRDVRRLRTKTFVHDDAKRELALGRLLRNYTSSMTKDEAAGP